jgi:hypothetical protein
MTSGPWADGCLASTFLHSSLEDFLTKATPVHLLRRTIENIGSKQNNIL